MYLVTSAATAMVGTGDNYGGRTRRYINYINRKLAGLAQHLYDNHWTISTMDIE